MLLLVVAEHADSLFHDGGLVGHEGEGQGEVQVGLGHELIDLLVLAPFRQVSQKGEELGGED